MSVGETWLRGVSIKCPTNKVFAMLTMLGTTTSTIGNLRKKVGITNSVRTCREWNHFPIRIWSYFNQKCFFVVWALNTFTSSTEAAWWRTNSQTSDRGRPSCSSWVQRKNSGEARTACLWDSVLTIRVFILITSLGLVMYPNSTCALRATWRACWSNCSWN